MIYKLGLGVREKIIETIKEESQPDKYFFIMVILSCIIATYGLLSNSVAVIIGAMLIAPLMYPILKGALSLTIGSNTLFKNALYAEFLGVVISITCAVFLTLLLPITELNTEILARTKPTLIDLVIAIASGFAGTVAICYRPSSAILPGVAIASALMPPLCVVGIGIAKQDYNVAGGALLLFLSNIIAINVAGIIVFELVGFGEKFFQFDKKNFAKELISKRFIYSLVLLLLVSAPLFFFMKKSYDNTNIENQITTVLRDGVTLIDPSNELVSINFKNKDNKIVVRTAFRSVKNLSPEDIRRFENKLEYELGSQVEIIAEVIPIVIVNDLESSVSNKSSFGKETIQPVKVETIEDLLETTINEKLSLIPDSKMIDYSFKYSHSSGTYDIYTKIKSNKILDENLQNSIKQKLENSIHRKILLHIEKI